MKLFISQPMNGKTDEEILAERERLIGIAERTMGEKMEPLDTFFKDYTPTAPYQGVAFLGKSIMALAEADVAIFGPEWEQYRGCRIENKVCLDYGITIIESYSKR